MYDLHRLRLLRELALRGTLAAVAEALNYSPSSVSQQLSQLEVEAGVRLLEPAGRRVRLTPQARILVRHADAVFHQLDLAESELAASVTELTGELRVATFQTATLALLPTALTALRAAHPRLLIRVSDRYLEQALPALSARDFDLVLAEEYPDVPVPRSAGVEFTALCTDTLRLACGGRARLRDLADRAWVMEPVGSPARHWAVTTCREAGFEPDVRFESADPLLHARMVEQGHAVAFLPDLVWGGTSATLPLVDLPARRRTRRILTACRTGASGHPAIRALRVALSEAARAAGARPIGSPAGGRA